ncbi:lipoate--protein ligase [Ilyobacter polytropus]|uniref:lipoate--protein ligase n=1 Tax=Ilyobacter polytropus (strain ATCC 51220 / DSM 2926 / LMG 16218 / CuHBu1) TaxID=572544 RepID=E3HAD2_ILYPC|nr:lipoate--protein ligase [Ilyobacter polytropus]ADO83662.1 lipoate-protein ligase [Ilyobacter polytropus DSM 2926]
MFNIINESKDPYFNLALEEYALKNIEGDIVIFWQNENTVVVGRNQNTHEEINHEYVNKNNVNVVRRLSGGGAVYHDNGNLNFTFITDGKRENVNNYKKFTEPVVNVLKLLRVEAEFSGRNDIVIDEKKISGNAQYYFGNRMLHHGTLLFDADLSVLGKVLNVKYDKIESKGIKSVRSRVTNIYPYLKEKLMIEEFKKILISNILMEGARNYILSDTENLAVENLAKEKYRDWDWNFGKSPEFKISKRKRYDGGELDIRINVSEGRIDEIKIYGDFLGYRGTEEIEKVLTGKRFNEKELADCIKDVDIQKYFYDIKKEDIIDCIFY